MADEMRRFKGSDEKNPFEAMSERFDRAAQLLGLDEDLALAGSRRAGRGQAEPIEEEAGCGVALLGDDQDDVVEVGFAPDGRGELQDRGAGVPGHLAATLAHGLAGS